MVSDRIPLLRSHDLLVLDLEVENLHLELSPTPHLRRIDPAADAFLKFAFPPQAFAEEIAGADPRLLHARAASETMLVFQVPTVMTEIAFTLAALLDWRQFTRTPNPGYGQNRTFVEAPFRLQIALPERSFWRLPEAFPAGNPLVPLWNAELRSSAGQAAMDIPGIWNRFSTIVEPDVKTTFDDEFRRAIQSNSQQGGSGTVKLHGLRLSALGAWTELAGELSATSYGKPWRIRQAMGRECDVLTVGTGTLFPFGHRAAVVENTRRFFRHHTDHRDAELHKFGVIVVREAVRQYDALPLSDRRNVPFRQVEIVTRETPEFEDTGEIAYCPIVDGKRFRFDLVGIDWDGKACAFSMPLLFARDGATGFETLNREWTAIPDTERESAMKNQSIAFAPAYRYTEPDEPEKPAECAFPTESMRFIGTGAKALPGVRYAPALETARVHIPAIQALSGNPSATTVRYNQAVYLTEGNGGGNLGHVMFDIVSEQESPPALALRNDQAGGLGNLQLGLDAFSPRLGPIDAGGREPQDIEKFARNMVDPIIYLNKLLEPIKLLGTLSLKDLIDPSHGDLQGSVPKIRTLTRQDAIETGFVWDITLKDQAKLHLDVTRIAPISAGVEAPTASSMKGTLSNYTFNFADALTIVFERIEFSRSATGATTMNAVVKPGGVTFQGDLAFLDKLQPFLNNSLDSGPMVDVGPNGVRVGYGIAVPAIGMGAIVLQNVAISAELLLPFGEPSADMPMLFRFAFCSRERPFQLSVYGLGGGGFVAIELTPDGLSRLEISLEFGAIVALNLVLASGSASVTAGIYIDCRATQAPTLTGFVRAVGSLTVLGLVTISAEFYLGLSCDGKVAHGIAYLTVGIEVLCFSKEVTLTIERSFSTDDLDFDRMSSPFVDPMQWREYRKAFVA